MAAGGTRLSDVPRRTPFLTFTALAASAVLLAACGGDDDASSPTTTTAGGSTTTSAPSTDDTAATTLPEVGELQLVDLDLDVREPIDLTARPGSTSLLIAERGGRIVEAVADGDGFTVADEPVIDLTERVGSTDAEKGLLGIAVSPEGDRLYASYTEADNGDSRVDAYDLSGDDGTLRADPGSRRELVAIEQPYPNHNGGSLAVGPDGMLYAGFGDGGSADDPEGRAQDPTTLLGKVLRLDPEGRDDADGDGVPDDNPFVVDGAPFEAEPEILLTGVRNPWRMAFDTETGDLWIADVGQNEEEEINRLAPEGSAPAGFGANLGWDLFEGTREFESPDPAGGAAGAGPFTTPVFTYSHDEGCSVTGGQVYRGDAIPGLTGAYLFSDFCNPAVRAVREGADGTFSELDLGLEAAGAVAAFGRGPDGELYVVSLDAGVSRIAPA